MFNLMIRICLLLGVCSTLQAKDIIHTEKSLYRNISVVKEDSLLCLVFETRKDNPPYQTCVDETDKKRLVFSYTKLVLSGLLYKPEADHILVIGLGGGTLPMTLKELLPEAKITSVEIDPSVTKIARQYFDYQEDDRIDTVTQDGRLFIKRAALNNKQYDWIILDAFNGDYIPEHLMTQEFLQEVKQVLTDDGIVTANTFSESKLYAYESATYQSVFGDFYNVKRRNTGNRIVLATNNKSLKPLPIIKQNAEKWQTAFDVFGVDSDWIYHRFTPEKDWDESSEILTDQYAPVNLLKND